MSTNDITGDALKSKATTDAFREGYDRIWSKVTAKVVTQKDLEDALAEDEAFRAIEAEQEASWAQSDKQLEDAINAGLWDDRLKEAEAEYEQMYADPKDPNNDQPASTSAGGALDPSGHLHPPAQPKLRRCDLLGLCGHLLVAAASTTPNPTI